MKKYLLFGFILLHTGIITLAQHLPVDITAKYIKIPVGYLMVLHQGDSVLPALEAIAVKENIPSATFSGMGFVNAVFGFYNRNTRKFDPKTFNDMELASMNGSIAWQENKVSIHAHGVVTDKNFQAFGGHLLAAMVGTGSLEITITVHDKRLQRKIDPAIGANVLQMPGQQVN